MLRRFVERRLVSTETPAFLAWCNEYLAAQGLTAVRLLWDNASWQISQEVRRWLRQHNHTVKQMGQGVRILACRLPSKNPWLNPIEPAWVHGKRAIVAPARRLSAQEIMDGEHAVMLPFPIPAVESAPTPDRVCRAMWHIAARTSDGCAPHTPRPRSACAVQDHSLGAPLRSPPASRLAPATERWVGRAASGHLARVPAMAQRLCGCV